MINCERLPDPIERGEARAAAWESRTEVDWEAGTFICSGCNQRKSTENWDSPSPDPYSEPVCGDCFEEWLFENGLIDTDGDWTELYLGPCGEITIA